MTKESWVRTGARAASCLLLLAALGGPAALAGDAAPDAGARPLLEKAIMVTATRISQKLSQTGASVTVITDDRMQEEQIDTAAGALDRVPGAFVSRGGPLGAPTSLFLRGAASNQTVVIVDGVKVNDPTIGGQFNFYDLGVENVRQVEVLRGGASALYGSEAIGGVVDFVTRKGEGAPTVSTIDEIGSFGTYRTGLSTQGAVGPFDFSGAVSRVRTLNNLRREAFTGDTYAVRVGYDLGAGLRLDLRGRLIRSRAEDPFDYPTGTRIPTDPNIVRSRDTALGRLEVSQRLSKVISWSVSGSLFDVSSYLTNGPDRRGGPLELATRARAQARDLQASVRVEPPMPVYWAQVSMLAGAEYRAEISKDSVRTAFGTSPPIHRAVRRPSLFFLGRAVVFDRLTLSGGVRRQHDSFFGLATTVSGSVLYRLPFAGASLQANYGEGYRAPTPVEFDDPYVGNRNLGPERSASFDFGVSERLFAGRLEIGADWFQLRTSDLIAYDAASGRLQNLSHTRTRGVELSVTARPLYGLTVRFHGTAQDPRLLDPGPGQSSRLPGRPRWFGGVDVDYRRGPWSAGLSLLASGDAPTGDVRVAPSGERRTHPGSKLVLGIRSAYEVLPGVVVTARVENLTDDHYYDTETGPPGRPRAFFVGIRMKF